MGLERDIPVWRWVMDQVGLPLRQQEIFLDCFLLGRQPVEVAAEHETTSVNVRNLANHAAKILQDTRTYAGWDEERRMVAWLKLEGYVRGKREANEECSWAEAILDCLRGPEASSPATPQYDHLGRRVAAHEPIIDAEDVAYISVYGKLSPTPRVSAKEHKRIKERIDRRADQKK